MIRLELEANDPSDLRKQMMEFLGYEAVTLPPAALGGKQIADPGILTEPQYADSEADTMAPPVPQEPAPTLVAVKPKRARGRPPKSEAVPSSAPVSASTAPEAQPAAPQGDPSPASAEPAKTQAVAAADAPAVPLADVKAALQRVANRYPDDADKGMLEASAIIKEFGYTVVRDIKPEHFAPIVARVAAHLAA